MPQGILARTCVEEVVIYRDAGGIPGCIGTDCSSLAVQPIGEVGRVT